MATIQYILVIWALLMCVFAQARSVDEAIKGSASRTHHDDGKLIFSHLLWRHGDRTPASFVPTDPYQDPSEWPVGLGQLTNLGKQQHYQLGKWLRNRYHGFLPEAYSEQDIYVRSTDVDRTLASAYSNLAGLYPPTGNQVWNKNLLWQPIPVHTYPDTIDYVLGGSLPKCPVYERLTNELLQSSEIVAFIKERQHTIDIIFANSGLTKTNNSFDILLDTLLVRDTLFIETIYKKSLPAWTNSIYPSKEFDELALLYYILPSYNKQLAKFRVGYFLKELLDRSQAKAAGKLVPDRKVWVYSAHDINISTVLKGLDLWDGEFVQYSAALLFELRQKSNGTVFLSISYRRRAGDIHAEVLNIPGCGKQCELSKLYEIYSDILPTQSFDEACLA